MEKMNLRVGDKVEYNNEYDPLNGRIGIVTDIFIDDCGEYYALGDTQARGTTKRITDVTVQLEDGTILETIPANLRRVE